MQLQKQLISLRFGEQEQLHGSKLRIAGQVAAAWDVFQKKTAVYQQRNGKAALNTTTDTGSITTGRGLAASHAGLVLQTADSVFARASTAAKWISKGSSTTAFMGWQEAIPNLGTRPTAVSINGQTWTFVYDSTNNYWWYRVTEDADGTTIQPLTAATTITDAGSAAGWGRPVVAGGFVWFFWIASTALIKVAKFNPTSPGTAPTITTYYNHTTTVGGTLQGFDVMSTSTANQPIVVTYGSTSNIGLSFLDSTSGFPTGTPGVVTVAAGSGNSGQFLRGGDGSNGSFYYISDNKLLTLDATALTATTTDTLSSLGSSNNQQIVGGYWDGTSKVVLFSNFADNAGPTLDIENATITKVVKGSGAAVYTNIARASYQASTPFKVGSTWYVLTAHDDTVNLQRAYYLRDASTGKILARTLYQLGGDVCGRGGFTSATGVQNFAWAGEPTVSGTTVTIPVNANLLGTSDYQTVTLTIEISATTGPLTTLPSGDQVRIPGGWPIETAVNAPLFEQAPPMYPRTFSVATNGATWANGTYGFVTVFATITPGGDITRSSPSPVVTKTFSGGTQGPNIAVPTLRTTNITVGTYIELYATLAGQTDLFLVKTVANDPTVDSITFSSVSQTYGEALYTTGNVLSNIAPPPHRVSVFWKDRVVVTDTDIAGEIWPSKQITTGRGVEFSDISIVRLITGRHRALGVIDENYLAVFQSDGISVLFGAGQSDTGSGGNYQSLKLPWALGTTNPASVVTGPQGCFFQATDGGIYLVDRGLQVSYAGAGVDDHKSATVTSAVHVPKQRHIRFFLSTGKVLVLDYGNVESSPLGKWYVWSNHSAVAATVSGDVCWHVDSTGVVRQEVDGQTYDDASTPILPKIQLATISFAGLLGYSRCYRGQFEGEFRGNHSLKITLTPDFTGTPQIEGPRAITSAPESFEFKPTQSKVTALDVTIERTGSDTTDSFTFEGLAFEVGIRPGMRRLNVAQRI